MFIHSFRGSLNVEKDNNKWLQGQNYNLAMRKLYFYLWQENVCSSNDNIYFLSQKLAQNIQPKEFFFSFIRSYVFFVKWVKLVKRKLITIKFFIKSLNQKRNCTAKNICQTKH